MKVAIINVNGKCLNNAYLSVCAKDFMKANSWQLSENGSTADIIMINGCNVTDRNYALALKFREIARRYPRKRVVFLGCVPKFPASFRPPANFMVFPYWKLVRQPDAVSKALSARAPFAMAHTDTAIPGSVRAIWKRNPKDLYYMTISHGCTSRCSYCAIKYGKGPLKSLPAAAILEDFKKGVKKGRKRFVLLADDAACWGRDIGTDLSRLLRAMQKLCPSARFVIPAFNPAGLKFLFERMKPCWNAVGFLSLPVQSGSSRILRLMNRNYDIGKVLDAVRWLRKNHPGMSLNTDIIVGFPTETRAEFLESVKAAMHFKSACFPVFAPQPGTPAAKLRGRVPQKELDHRISIVKKLAGRYNFETDFQKPQFLA